MMSDLPKVSEGFAIVAAGESGLRRPNTADKPARRDTTWREAFIDLAGHHGGDRLEGVGEEMLARFDTAAAALRFAMDLQQHSRDRNSALAPAAQTELCVGIATSSGIERDGAPIEGADVAASLQALAPLGGICVSRPVYESVVSRSTVAFADLGLQLKNSLDPVHVYLVQRPRGDRSVWTLPQRASNDGQTAIWVGILLILMIVAGVAAFVMAGRQTALEISTPISIKEPRARAPMQAGELLRDCAFCPELVVVPTGEFLMGSSNEDIESGIAGTNEAPQRRVALKHPLAVGRHEVTREQFAAFISATGYPYGGKCWILENNTPQERHDRSFRDPGYRQTDSDPVVCVSWNDAKAYVAWLSKSTGKTYRLLAEAEWEYIARAGATTRYHFGNNETELCEFANGADRSAREAGLPDTWDYLRCNDGHVYTSPVGSFRPNAFGIFDVIGNVWEWTEDCYAESLAETPLDGPTRSDRDCQFRSARGGSWSGTARMLRAAVRGKASQDNRYDDIGFRVARTLMP